MDVYDRRCPFAINNGVAGWRQVREIRLYNVKHLFGVAWDGLSDMLPAMRQAFNEDRDDDKLDKVYGSNPRFRILALSVLGIVAGETATRLMPRTLINDYVNWSAILIAASFALLIRRYLFSSPHARDEDFPWLAASLIPAAICLVVVAFVVQFINGSLDYLDDAPAWTAIGAILVALVHAIGVAAALSIAVAAICYSRNLLSALKDLAVQLFVFKLMVFITVLVVVDVGFVGPILGRLVESAFGIQFPDWLPDLVDQLSLVGLLLIAYMAVIGAVWTVCRQSFATLLAEGDVNVMATIKNMARAPKKKKAKNLKKNQSV